MFKNWLNREYLKSISILRSSIWHLLLLKYFRTACTCIYHIRL